MLRVGAVVPPMSKQSISEMPSSRPRYWLAITAAVGPDSMTRSGSSAAVAAQMTPPEESVTNSRPAKPRSSRRRDRAPR